MDKHPFMNSRPNIIFIVADDLGFADLGCYGGRDAKFGKVSPVLDQLAAGGLKFTQGYANSPVCSPTRFALMTARYQYRLRGGADEPINSKSKGSTVLGLPPEHPTLPSLLKASGYRTALIGKWHLGYPPHFSPIKSGYEEFFGPMSGGVDYFTHASNNGTHDLYANEEEKHEDGYLTDLISHKAVDFVERMAPGAAQGTPFFLSLHYTAPHWPWETREDHALAQEVKDNLFHLHGGNIHTYHRMIHHMDEGIGWVVDALKKTGQLDNTLIVFTSDNGGERFSDNWPLVGGKMDLIMHCWAEVPPGAMTAGQCAIHGTRMPPSAMDWSATMVELAGAKAHEDLPFDGVSMLPVLRDAEHQFDRPLHWRMNHRGQRALRMGDYKYLRVDGIDYLFNIPGDERERANLAKREPERLDAMRAAWEAWDATVPAIPEDATISLGYSVKDMPQR
jgi:arylsulfatase A-like enzyme